MGKERLVTRLAKWIANRLPRRVVYFAAVRVWANAATGRWSHKDATTVTASDAVKRWGYSINWNGRGR